MGLEAEFLGPFAIPSAAVRKFAGNGVTVRDVDDGSKAELKTKPDDARGTPFTRRLVAAMRAPGDLDPDSVRIPLSGGHESREGTG
jgi:hypothetical protein